MMFDFFFILCIICFHFGDFLLTNSFVYLFLNFELIKNLTFMHLIGRSELYFIEKFCRIRSGWNALSNSSGIRFGSDKFRSDHLQISNIFQVSDSKRSIQSNAHLYCEATNFSLISDLLFPFDRFNYKISSRQNTSVISWKKYPVGRKNCQPSTPLFLFGLKFNAPGLIWKVFSLVRMTFEVNCLKIQNALTVLIPTSRFVFFVNLFAQCALN